MKLALAKVASTAMIAYTACTPRWTKSGPAIRSPAGPASWLIVISDWITLPEAGDELAREQRDDRAVADHAGSGSAALSCVIAQMLGWARMIAKQTSSITPVAISVSSGRSSTGRSVCESAAT